MFSALPDGATEENRFNHFNVFHPKGAVGAALPSYLDDALRPHLSGPFRVLLGAATLHPAMLLYLDNAQNAAGRINENHARELLELHTLGVDGGYTQRDVQEVARVLTGAGLRPLQPVRWPPMLEPLVREDGEFLFDPRRHDTAPKIILGQPLHGEGFAEVDALLDRLAAHPATARHLTRKLATFLLGDEPKAAALAAGERAFLDTGGHLGRLTDALLAHATMATDSAALTDPTRWVLDSLRLLAAGRALQDARPPINWLARLGQPLYGRSTPDGYPLHSREWANSGQIVQRIELARVMAGQQRRIFDQPMEAREVLGSPAVQQWIRRLGPDSRQALAQGANPAEQLALLLVSPEFMSRRPLQDTA